MASRGVTMSDTYLDSRRMVDAADTFAEVFDRERRTRRWSKTRTGEFFGVNQSTISRWCSGDLLPGENLIPQLAEFLGLDPDTVRSLKYKIEPVSFGKLEANQDELTDRVATVEREMGNLRAELGLLHRIVDRIARLVDRGDSTAGGDSSGSDGLIESPMAEFHSDVPVDEAPPDIQS